LEDVPVTTDREAQLPSENSGGENEMARQLAEKFGLELVEEVTDDMLAPDLVAKLPVEWARTRLVLPIRWKGDLCILLADPAQMGSRKDLALLLGEELKPVLAARNVISRSIERCYFRKSDSASDFMKDLQEPVPTGTAEARRSDDLLQVAEQAPVTQLVNLILLEAVKARASDIHFEPFESRLRVRYRIDGILYEQTAPPKHMEAALISRLKVMGHVDIAERRLPQDGMARVRVGEREIDIRLSTMPVAEGERVVLRLLDRDSSLLPLSALGLEERSMELFLDILRQPNGLVLVTGPTGSGKTTTLYAALRHLDTRQRNVMTIEEPIEYQLPDIGQIQVKPKIGLTFARGLRHILRQDPDVILVGETRDLETAEIAVRAALTGHLVFTTLHTNDAPSAVIRMLDMGIEPYLLAAALRAALAQRLVRRLCPRCRTPAEVRKEDLLALGAAGKRLEGRSAWAARGCKDCLGGYKGRTALFEMMGVDAEMEEVIRTGGGSTKALRKLLVDRGVPTLVDDGARKIMAGETSVDEVLRVIGQID
jgi:general secretion pathway protein E